MPDATGLELLAQELREADSDAVLDTLFFRDRATLIVNPARVRSSTVRVKPGSFSRYACANSSARVMSLAPMARAAFTSGTVSSTAAEVTTMKSARVMPLPSWGWSLIPRARRNSNLSAVRP